MKTLITAIFLLHISFFQLLGQSENDNVKYQFAKDVFKTDYKKKYFDRFTGKIERINETSFRFGDKVLTLYLDDETLLNIFLKGIFYPDIISGKHTTKTLTKSELDTMTATRRVFYNLSRNDSLTIGNIEELENLNPDYKTKRYKFWLSSSHVSNPTECYFELYNRQGNKKMTNEEFIENSRLTFYYRGTLII